MRELVSSSEWEYVGESRIMKRPILSHNRFEHFTSNVNHPFKGPFIYPLFWGSTSSWIQKMLILVFFFWLASRNPDVLTDKHNIDHKRKILNISLLRSVLADFGWFWISAGNRVRIEISWRIYFIWIFYIKYYINIFLYKWI